jgi:hypothetical protein
MKKGLSALLVCAAMVGFLAQAADAAPYEYDSPGNILFENNGDYLLYTFTIGPLQGSISSARLAAWAHDDGDKGNEVMVISAGASLVPIYYPSPFEMPDNSTMYGWWDVLPYIDNGSLTLAVKAASGTGGDFYFDKFVLQIEEGAPVPIPSAAIMLATGLIGFVALRRRSRA